MLNNTESSLPWVPLAGYSGEGLVPSFFAQPSLFEERGIIDVVRLAGNILVFNIKLSVHVVCYFERRVTSDIMFDRT